MDIRSLLGSRNRRLGNDNEPSFSANKRPIQPTHRYTFWITLGYLGLTTLLGISLARQGIVSQTAQAAPQSSVGRGVAFKCSDSEATIKAKAGPSLTFGKTSIYIGYQQVSSINKDPRIIRFDNGVRVWCRSDYETTGDDGTGYGLLWDSENVLYGVFSSTGSQTGNDFRRFATNGWLTSYGSGGGPKVAVLARINITNGDVNYATFISAKKPSDGKTNSLVVKGLSWTGTSVIVQADSYFSPRRTDKTSMNCSGSSPFSYRLEIANDLRRALSASADRCS